MEGQKSKKKKTTWKPVNTACIIDSTRPTSLGTNWADEVAKEIDGNIMETRIPPKVELPTAPRASRGSAIDESKIPTIGPFQAYLSNIPYDLNEEELIAFFQDLKVKSVKLPKEEKTSRAKGFGYIEFEDRAALSAALSLGDTMLKGRVIKIDLPNHADMGGRGNRRGNRDGRDQHSSDRTTGNWRSGPRADDFEDRGGYDRGYGGRRDYGAGGGGSGGGGSGFSRGGFDREERGFYREDRERFDRGGRDDRGRDDRSGGGGGFRERYDRDRGFGGRDREGYSYNDRGFRDRGRDDDRYSRNEERGAGGGSSSGQWRDEPRENRGFGGGGGGGRGGFEERRDRDREGGKFGPPPRRDDPPMDRGGGGSSESRNRPKLQLQPRTKPKEISSETASASASIFGGAKPVDTAAREREIEERLMRSEDFSDARSSRSGPGSTGSRGGERGEREKQWEPAEKRVEPAPPPKENAWSRKAPQTIVNNGRSSPEDDGSRSNIDSDERSHDESRSNRTGDESRGSLKGPGSAEKARGKESERHTNKQRDGKDSSDDISKMPKVPESKTPNFAGSNKYSTLDDAEEASNE